LHLEGGLPLAVRVRGELKAGGQPLPPEVLVGIAKELLGEENWAQFLHRRSFDLSRTVLGIRCRINVMKTQRGVGLAIRLLSSFQPTIAKLNLHPSLAALATDPHGLIVVSGPTGSGKSSTLAALIHEINVAQSCHIVTIENPIEYVFRPRRAFIRQREVGFDTPSFRQGVIDVMREDPDVIMVGEMRESETMRQTLNAAETGHLVLTTLHSSNVGEALARIVGAFPAEIQGGISAQLADCMSAVITQRLVYQPERGIRVPELEILRSTPAVRNHVRQGQFFKLQSTLETGGAEGMFTLSRYREWLGQRREWYLPRPGDSEPPDSAPSRTEREALTDAAHVELADPSRADVMNIDAPAESMDEILSELRFFKRR
ncbi:MAG: type IV pilus twitching motility protein PilT, partial [Candidatus Binatia bacterium]